MDKGFEIKLAQLGYISICFGQLASDKTIDKPGNRRDRFKRKGNIFSFAVFRYLQIFSDSGCSWH